MCIYDEYKEGHERCGKTITRGILTQVTAFDMIHYPQQLEEKNGTEYIHDDDVRNYCSIG